MRNNTIKYVIALAIISIIGIFVTQTYWVRKAFSIEEKKFNQTVNISLKNVAEAIAKLNGSVTKAKPIKQLSSDYYVVNVNDMIDAAVLEKLLIDEFHKNNLNMDFEYGIYDCNSDEVIHGNYVSNKVIVKSKSESPLPKWEEFNYYFGVRFPTKSTYLASKMDIWIFSSAILLIVVLFFGYTIFVILKQKQLSEIQRDFINNMTHEFKTPISTIAVSTDLITNPKIIEKPEHINKYAKIIKVQNNRLKNQIDKVLQMAVMDRGRLKLSKESVDLHQIIREAVQNFSLRDEADIQCNLQEGEICIYADKVHLTNVIYSLLDNATKYSKDTPKIQIKTEQLKNQILFSIEDNGIGISKEHQKKVFEKFFRVPTGNVHDVKGFGLGLNYVKKIVKAHKWKVKLDSELGKGSKFTFLMSSEKPKIKNEKKEEAVLAY